MGIPIYLDYNATTPIDPNVRDAMLPYLGEHFGNPLPATMPNFYVSLIERSTGKGVVEIIIDRYSGSYQPEPQSMMWNSKYGMMGQSQTAEMTVTSQQTLKITQDFLDIVYPGIEAGEIVSYYGYYTIMTTLKGKHYGMLSVNGYSGDVCYHTWHGMFISEVEEFHDEGKDGH